MKRIIPLMIILASCKTYTGIRMTSCGGYQIYTDHHKKPQPTYELFNGYWLVRDGDNAALVPDTVGSLKRLRQHINIGCH